MAIYALVVDEVVTQSMVIEPEMVEFFKASGTFAGDFVDVTNVEPRPGEGWLRKGGKKWQAPVYVPPVDPEPVVEDGVELPGTSDSARLKAAEEAIDFLMTMMLEG